MSSGTGVKACWRLQPSLTPLLGWGRKGWLRQQWGWLCGRAPLYSCIDTAPAVKGFAQLPVDAGHELITWPVLVIVVWPAVV